MESVKYERLRRFARFIWQERRVSLAIFLCSLVFPLFGIPLPFMFKGLVDSLAYNPDISSIIRSSLWLAMAYFAVKIGEGLQEYFTQKYRERTTVRLKNLFFRHFMHIELGFYSKQGSGYFIGRMNEVDNLRDLFIDQLGGAISALSLGLISFILLLNINLPCALIFLAYIPLEIWGILRIRRQIVQKSKTVREAQACLTEQAQEYMQNVEKIKSSGLGQRIFEKFKVSNEKAYHSVVNLAKWRISFDTVIECASLPFFISAFVVLGISVVKGTRTVGDLIAMNQLGTYFLGSFLRLTAIFQQAFVSLASFERVFDILEKEPEIKEGTISLPSFLNGHRHTKITGEGLYFKYPNQPDYAIKGVNFEVSHGERVVIVGHSGAGKTTLFKLIVRMYDPEKGRISIGNTAAASLQFDALRSLVTYLPQEPFLLKGSIMDNFRLFAPDKNNSQIIEIIESTGLEQFFKSLPDGYNTFINEMGRGLSGGERQAISLARAFLGNPQIILLDEPTSWQDPFLENIAIKSIIKMAETTAVLIIAHKPSTVHACDRILLMDKGDIIDSGDHDTLLSRNSIYASYFANLQKKPKSTMREDN